MLARFKVRVLNFILVSLGVGALMFTMAASWVIMQEIAEIIRGLVYSSEATIACIILLGLVLFWMNSILLDSVIWTISSFWKTNKGVENE